MNKILQKRIKEAAENLINYNLVDLEDLVNQYDLRRMLIEMGVKTLQNQWISVDEALPEDDENVLLIFDDGHIIVAYHSENYWWWCDGFVCGTKTNGQPMYSSSQRIEGYNKPTNWMPIPSLEGGEQ